MSDTATIVTSETLQEFNAARLKPSPDEPKPEPTEAKPEVADELIDDAEADGKPEGRKKGINGRFSELTEARKTAEARAEREERRAAEAERERDELRAKLEPKPKVADEAPKPKAEDYTDAFEYAEDLAEWTAEDVLRKRDKADSDKRAQAEAAKVQKAWNSRLTAAKADLPDFDDVIDSSEVQVSDPVRDALVESEYGPQILYLLASEPDIAEKLAKMTVLGQLREIGKLELKFEKAPEEKVEKPEPEPKPRPRAPAPITPVKGGKTPDNPVESPGEFKGSFREWKAARQKH